MNNEKLSKLLSNFVHSRVLSILSLLVILLALPVTIFVAQQRQETRQRASETSPRVTCDSPKGQTVAPGTITFTATIYGTDRIKVPGKLRYNLSSANTQKIGSVDISEPIREVNMTGSDTLNITATGSQSWRLGELQFQPNDPNDYGHIVNFGYCNANYTIGNATATNTPTPTNISINNQEIHGTVWIDENGDGIKQANETQYKSDVTITLSGAKNETQTTAASGQYYFRGLSPGNYTVTITVPNGYSITGGTGGTTPSKDVTISNNFADVSWGIKQISAPNASVTCDSPTTTNGQTPVFRPGSVTLTGKLHGTSAINGPGRITGVFMIDGIEQDPFQINGPFNSSDITVTTNVNTTENKPYIWTIKGAVFVPQSDPSKRVNFGDCKNVGNFIISSNTPTPTLAAGCPASNLNPTVDSNMTRSANGNTTYVTIRWNDVLAGSPDNQKDYRLRISDSNPGHSIRIDGDNISSNCDENANNQLDVCKDSWHSNSMTLAVDTPNAPVSYGWWMHAVKQGCQVVNSSGPMFTVNPPGSISPTLSTTATATPTPGEGKYSISGSVRINMGSYYTGVKDVVVAARKGSEQEISIDTNQYGNYHLGKLTEGQYSMSISNIPEGYELVGSTTRTVNLSDKNKNPYVYWTLQPIPTVTIHPSISVTPKPSNTITPTSSPEIPKVKFKDMTPLSNTKVKEKESVKFSFTIEDKDKRTATRNITVTLVDRSSKKPGTTIKYFSYTNSDLKNDAIQRKFDTNLAAGYYSWSITLDLEAKDGTTLGVISSSNVDFQVEPSDQSGLYNISGSVFNDINDNKTRDWGTEPGFGGIVLSLERINAPSSADNKKYTVVTLENGYYEIQELNAGMYKIKVQSIPSDRWPNNDKWIITPSYAIKVLPSQTTNTDFAIKLPANNNIRFSAAAYEKQTPSNKSTITPTYGNDTTATPTEGTNTTKLSLALKLQSIGKQNGENQNPKLPTREVKIEIYNPENTKITETTGNITFNKSSGLFTGNISINNLPTGDYIVKVITDKYLRRIIGKDTNQSLQHLVTGTENKLPQSSLIVGDINNDNGFNIQDYNEYLSCFGERAKTSTCSNLEKIDINNDGKTDNSTDLTDYRWLFESFKNESGD